MEKISLYERRRQLITVLYERQNDTIGNLAFEFSVSSQRKASENLLHGRQSRLITPPAKKSRAFPTGNALFYILLLSVAFSRVRPFRAHPVFVLRKNLRNKS